MQFCAGKLNLCVWRMSSNLSSSMLVGIWTTMTSYSDTINSQLIVMRWRKKWFSWEGICFTNLRGCLDLQSVDNLKVEFQVELGHSGNKCVCWEVGLTFPGSFSWVCLFVYFFWRQEKFTAISPAKTLKKPTYLVQFVLSAEAVADIKKVPSSQMTLNLKC